MKLTILALLVLFIVPSCTIERRLHNQGWNIQWRKRQDWREEVSITSENRESALDQKEKFYEIRELTNASVEIDQERIEEDFELESRRKKDVSSFSLTLDSTPVDTTKRTVLVNSEESRSRINRTEASEIRRKIGTMLMVLGIVLILGLLCLPWIFLASAVTLLDVLGALVLGFFCAVFGLFFLLVGISLISKSKKMASQA